MIIHDIKSIFEIYRRRVYISLLLNVKHHSFSLYINVESIDTFHKYSKILPNMFRDKASILMEARSKRMPNFTTSVVGFGLVLVKQKID